MTNAVTVARIHVVNSVQAVLMPWGILGSAFVINLLIFASVGDIPEEDRVTGALASIYLVSMIACIQSVTQFFPFVAGLSRTRRDFLAGTGLFVLGQSVVNALLLCVLGRVGRATDGWGLKVRFFEPSFLVQDSVVAQLLVYLVPFLALCALGLAVGALVKRWGQTGMFTLMIASILIGGGLVALASWRGWWGDVGGFFTDTSVLALAAGYPLVLAAVFAGSTYAILRRTTP
jgi:hypothetical protein